MMKVISNLSKIGSTTIAVSNTLQIRNGNIDPSKFIVNMKEDIV